MSKKIIMKILPNGKIEAHVEGVKGKRCVAYIKDIEEMLGAQVVNMEYTPEYYEAEEELASEQKTTEDETTSVVDDDI